MSNPKHFVITVGDYRDSRGRFFSLRTPFHRPLNRALYRIGASTFKEILSFQMSQYLDTINCCEYDSLKNTMDKFNHQQRQKAWEIADSLSKIEDPCYEFFIEFRGEKSIEDFAYYPGDCKMMWASFEILVVNSKWVIKRRRRTNITLTGSVICNEELK
jgi:hypothetical protein